MHRYASRYPPRLHRSLALALSAVLACAPWRPHARAWADERPAITAELRARAVPLSDSEAEPPAAAALWPMIRDARVIGLGEATHGTREFRRLMHALVIHAAQEDRPLAVALEVPFNMFLAVDAWVGAGWYAPEPQVRDRRFSALFGGDWLATVAENQAMFAWIRAWNERAPERRKIHVYGIDVCMTAGCGAEVVAWLRDLDPALAGPARALAEPLQALALERDPSPARAASARAGIAGLRDLLAQHRDTLVARRGPAAHAAAQRLLWLAERRVELALAHGDDPVSGERDQAMADTVTWISEQFGPGGRVLVLAHNGHVGRTRHRLPNGRIAAGSVMGEVLARRLGDDYVVVHTALDAGSFLAHHTRNTVGARTVRARALRSFALKPAPTGTLEATLRAPEPYVLDLRGAATGDAPLARYLRTWHWTRWHTYAWRELFNLIPTAWVGVSPADDFDVWVYFPRTTPTRLHTP